MIKFSIVVGVLNQFDLTRATVRSMVENLDRPDETEVILIDNGSDEEFVLDFGQMKHVAQMRVVRNAQNTGNYPLFKQGRDLAQGEIVAFMHSDVFVYQPGWDMTVRAQFDRPQVGLVGFIGSTELDSFGGRGMGTVSNMQGRTMVMLDRKSMAKEDVKESDPVVTKSWTGSAAKIHGRQDSGFIEDGSVVDGCVMIFRKTVLDRIEFKPDYPPHHFYDRMMSSQVIELGFKVGICGIEFDHVSGQVANQEQKWSDTAREWCQANLGIQTPQDWLTGNEAWMRQPNNPSRGQTPNGWDHVIYLEAERRFLQEFRDAKRIVPLYNGRSVNR